MNVIIKPSNTNDKTITAVLNNDKKIHFGDSRYSDYTLHKDTERKKAYLARHKKYNFNNPNYAGFDSTSLLWNKKTLAESKRDTNNKYKNLNIKLKS